MERKIGERFTDKMNAIEFNKFINENNIEFRWHENSDKKKDDVIFFVYFNQLKEMTKLLSSYSFEDEGISCIMKDGYFCFWASDILDLYDIELSDVFGKPEINN